MTTTIETAKTIGDVAHSASNMLTSIPALLVVFCLIAGLILVIQACFKLKEWSDSKGQVKLTNALLYLIGGVLLISITSTVAIGKNIMGLGEIKANEVLKLIEKKDSKAPKEYDSDTQHEY